MRSNNGRFNTGTIGLGTVCVKGRNRVPNPAARIMAFMGRKGSSEEGIAWRYQFNQGFVDSAASFFSESV